MLQGAYKEIKVHSVVSYTLGCVLGFVETCSL